VRASALALQEMAYSVRRFFHDCLQIPIERSDYVLDGLAADGLLVLHEIAPDRLPAPQIHKIYP
jgi:hypothetical protein